MRELAGIDLGGIQHEEIAVAVLAELVRLRAEEGLAAGFESAPTPETHEAIDPVCGMTVQVATARYRSVHDGETFYFCSPGCVKAFEANPAAFLTVS